MAPKPRKCPPLIERMSVQPSGHPWGSDLKGPPSLALNAATLDPGAAWLGTEHCLSSMVRETRAPRGLHQPCLVLSCSSRHSEVGVHPFGAVPREEFWNHHLSVGGAHGCAHALRGAQPGAGEHSPGRTPWTLCAHQVWRLGGDKLCTQAGPSLPAPVQLLGKTQISVTSRFL